MRLHVSPRHSRQRKPRAHVRTEGGEREGSADTTLAACELRGYLHHHRHAIVNADDAPLQFGISSRADRSGDRLCLGLHRSRRRRCCGRWGHRRRGHGPAGKVKLALHVLAVTSRAFLAATGSAGTYQVLGVRKRRRRGRRTRSNALQEMRAPRDSLRLALTSKQHVTCRGATRAGGPRQAEAEQTTTTASSICVDIQSGNIVI